MKKESEKRKRKEENRKKEKRRKEKTERRKVIMFGTLLIKECFTLCLHTILYNVSGFFLVSSPSIYFYLEFSRYPRFCVRFPFV